MDSRILQAARDYEADKCRENLTALRELVIDALGECCTGCGAHVDLVEDTDECPDCYNERCRIEGEMHQDAILNEADRRMRIAREDG